MASSASTLTPAALQARLAAAVGPLLVHVLPEDVFAASHLPGSVNACVYETAFVSKVAAIAPHKDQEIVVYGAGGASLDSQTAREKLTGAGYTHVRELEGGFAAWQAAGLPLEGAGALPTAPVLEGSFELDLAASVIRWTGRNLFNHHQGTVKLKAGSVSISEGLLTTARFVIDMGAIACEDLKDPALNAMLLAHLATPDFFDLAHYPTAEFSADCLTPLEAATPGRPVTTYRVTGLFTLRGITRPMTFAATVASLDGQSVTGQAMLTLDRTAHGSLYGSRKIYRFLGQHLVEDEVQLHVKLVASR